MDLDGIWYAVDLMNLILISSGLINIQRRGPNLGDFVSRKKRKEKCWFSCRHLHG